MAERWLIAGRVQGVGYRAWFISEAAALGVDGWVRNLPDGRVEAAVSGTVRALQRLRETAWRGPRAARVSAVEVLALEAELAPGFVVACDPE